MSTVRKYVLKPFVTKEHGERVDERHVGHTYAGAAKGNVKQLQKKSNQGKNFLRSAQIEDGKYT